MSTLKLLPAVLALIALSGCALLSGSPPSASHSATQRTNSAPVAGTIAAAAAAASSSEAERAALQKADSAPVSEWKDVTIKGAVPTANLWKRIRDGFELPEGHLHNGRVERQIELYTGLDGFMKRTAQRAKPYLYYIVERLSERNMPLDLALLPVVESAFNPFGYSSSDASGLWQFIPSTGRHYGLKQNWWYDGRRDVVAATRAALDYLQDLHKRFDGNWLLALAAYNSGGLTVEQAIAENKRRGEPTDFWHLDLPRQTQAYVPKLLAVRDIVAQPQKYGIELPFIANSRYLARIDLHGQIDLAIAAKMAGLSVKQMYMLNPGYSRWATPPNGPSYLLIPRGKKQAFLAKLENMDKRVMAKWVAHRIRRGETLSGIAANYHTSVAVLRHRNDLHGSLIRAGHTLMVPSPSAHVTRYIPPGATKYLERRGHPLTVRVRRGDTLWGIAQTYGVSVAQLTRWNHISTNATLRIGQRLRVWAQGYRRRGQAATVRVQRGDTLWDIAQNHGVSVTQLARWNHISRSATLQIGERLRVWAGRGSTARDNRASGPITVRVRHGDSLWELSRRYDVSVAQLADWNHISAQAVLHVGEKLRIWPGGHAAGGQKISYTVRSGDSLWSIANYFDVSLSKLANWNSMSLSSIIHPGQELTVFVNNPH